MQLIKVYSNKASFNTVEFNATGLNFVVAKQKNPDKAQKGKTYNGVGKSLLVRIIHFCLGASKGDYKSFCEQLEGWEFYLDFQIGGNVQTIKRTTAEPDKIVLNNDKMSVDKFKKAISPSCFNIQDNVPFLSFRSLIPFFIRPKKESYVAYNKPGKTGSDYQNLLYNAFLLGLDVTLTQRKHDIKKEKDRIKQLEKNFNNDSLLKDFFSGNKDVALTLIDLNENIKKLDDDLSKFQVAEDYHKIQTDADKIEKKLFDFNNNIILIQNNITNIDDSLKFSPDMNKNDLKSIYTESKINFPEQMTKTLNELEGFYEKLIANRTKRLLEQQNKLRIEEKGEIEISKKLQKELDGLMKYLGEHQALDLFVSISNKKAELQSQYDNLQKYHKLQAEYKVKERNIEKELLELSEITDSYLENIKQDTNELRNYFRTLAKVIYPDSIAGLTIDNNDGENQQRFNIEAKIESDASDGINNVKIFCYDLTVLFKGHNHSIDFLFHDSRLFDGIDERQKSEMFRIVEQLFSESTKQYIATVNQNQLNEIKTQMTPDEFDNIITKNTILTLTDDSDMEKLLGIKVDIGEK